MLKFGPLFKRKVRLTTKSATRFVFPWILQSKVLMTRLPLLTQAFTMILMLVATSSSMMVWLTCWSTKRMKNTRNLFAMFLTMVYLVLGKVLTLLVFPSTYQELLKRIAVISASVWITRLTTFQLHSFVRLKMFLISVNSLRKRTWKTFKSSLRLNHKKVSTTLKKSLKFLMVWWFLVVTWVLKFLLKMCQLFKSTWSSVVTN